MTSAKSLTRKGMLKGENKMRSGGEGLEKDGWMERSREILDEIYRGRLRIEGGI